MAKKSTPATTLWRVTVNEEVALDSITQALEATLAELMEKGQVREGSLLERIDVGGGKTVVYLSGEERASRALGKTLEARIRKGKVTCKGTTAKEVTAAT